MSSHSMPESSTMHMKGRNPSQPRRNLKKNQACLPCRQYKKKCDAAKPHCTNCLLEWEQELAVEGQTRPDMPPCVYDRVEGLVFTPELIQDPVERARVIEEHIALLNEKLYEAHEEHDKGGKKKRSAPAQVENTPKRRRTDPAMDSDSSAPDGLANSEGISSEARASMMAPLASSRLAPSAPETIVLHSPVPRAGIPELPSEDLMEQLLDLFIMHDPHASRVFHLRTLRSMLSEERKIQQVESSSTALLHALCAAASRYASPAIKRSNTLEGQDTAKRSSRPNSPPVPQLPKGFAVFHASRARKKINVALAEHQETLLMERQTENWTPLPRNLAPPYKTSLLDACAENNPELRKRKIRAIRDDKLFYDAVLPLLILTMYNYHEGKGPETWADVGALSRHITSLGVHRSIAEPTPRVSRRFLIINAERQRAFWSIFMLDRLMSAGAWVHSISDADSIDKLGICDPPVSVVSFNALQDFSSIVEITPAAPECDSLTLLIDASIMLGKVNDFLARARVKSRSSMAAISGIPSSSWNFLALLRSDPMIRMNFDRLNIALSLGVAQCNNRLDLNWRERPPISDRFRYILNIRPSLDTADGFNYGPKLDTDLYVAHLVHYATVILLNFPPSIYNGGEAYHAPVSFDATTACSDDSSCDEPLNLVGSLYPPSNEKLQVPIIRVSSVTSSSLVSEVPPAVAQRSCDVDPRLRCLEAGKGIANALALIRAIDFDISVLHPFAATSWYLACVVFLHEHQRCVAMGDVQEQRWMANQVQILRFSLSKYGQRSAVGLTHVQQLDIAQERISATKVISLNNGSISEVPESHQDFIPVFPFDAATFEALPDTIDVDSLATALPSIS